MSYEVNYKLLKQKVKEYQETYDNLSDVEKKAFIENAKLYGWTDDMESKDTE